MPPKWHTGDRVRLLQCACGMKACTATGRGGTVLGNKYSGVFGWSYRVAIDCASDPGTPGDIMEFVGWMLEDLDTRLQDVAKKLGIGKHIKNVGDK